MSQPWIPLTALCVGALISLPRSLMPPSVAALEETGQALQRSIPLVQAEAPQVAALQDLSNPPPQGRTVQWDAQAPDEDGTASLHAQSTDSLAGMTWILPRGILALHLREGQAQFIEEPHQWRVVAGDVHRLAVHWQQRLPAEPPVH
ncbi:MAG: hypothetical protein ACKOBF_07560 [Limnohabitans sp.]